MKSNFTFGLPLHGRSFLLTIRKTNFYFSSTLLLAVCCFFLSFQSFSQTFPPASNCTSKDLSLVAATLPFSKCETCTGGTVTKPLTLAINNKTGSTRTSFAFWATLVILNADGSVASTTQISKCFSTIPKNATTSYLYGNLSFQCGQSLILTNIWEAWTDASPNSTCPTLLNSTSTINPKCGTLPMLNIVAGDDANFNVTNATCTTTGSIQVSPFGGAGGPYTVTISNVNSTTVAQTVSIATGGSYTFQNLTSGVYTFGISDPNNCTPIVRTRTVTASGSVPVPTSGGDQTQCQQSPIQTLTATATTISGGTITWYNASSGGSVVANPTLNSVGTVTYYAQASNGTCTSATRTPVTLTISAAPSAPTSGGDQTECQQSPIQTLTATASGGTIAWYDASSGGNAVANPTLNAVGTVTYYAQSSNSTCNSLTRTPVSLTINAAPSAPTSGGDQTECAQNPVQTLTATASGGTITWYNAASGGNVVASPTLNAVGTVTYYAQSSNGTCNSLSRTPVSLTINASPAAPTSGGDQTQCAQNPVQTLTATASGGTITWYDAASGGNSVSSPTLNAVGIVTYYAQSSNGSCNSLSRTPVTLTINASPTAPDATPTQPTCVKGGSITITAVSGETFSFDDGAFSSTLTYGSLIPASSHTIVAKNSAGCTSATTTITLNNVPNAPNPPTICVTQPSLCGPTTGSVTILSPLGADYSYSIDNGTTWQSGTDFNGLAPGSVSGIKVMQNSTGCVSSAVSCDASNCSAPTISMVQTQSPVIANNQTTIKAYPNPFNNTVKFMVTNSTGGRGTLEVWNMLGQKVATVYQGYFAPGSSTYEFKSNESRTNGLIYRLVLGGKPITGKLIHIPGSN